MRVDELLDRLERVKKSGDGWTARCPAHEDRRSSLSIRGGDDGRVLLKCFAGCATDDVVAALGLEMRDLFAAKGEGGFKTSPNRVQPRNRRPDLRVVDGGEGAEGLTLEAYANAKRLPVAFLRGNRMTPAQVLRLLGKPDEVYRNNPRALCWRYTAPYMIEMCWGPKRQQAWIAHNIPPENASA